MKLPQMFVSGKNLEKKTEQLLEEPNATKETADCKEKWLIEEMIQTYQQLKEEDKQDQTKIQGLANQINSLEGQMGQRWEDFRSIYNHESLDAEIEAYLQEKGFKRVHKLNFFKDVFGLYKKDLKENPAYLSDNGHFFIINKNTKYNELYYKFGKLKNAKATYSFVLFNSAGYITSYVKYTLINTPLIAAVTGVATALLSETLSGILGGFFGAMLWLGYQMIQNSRNLKSKNTISTGPYEPVEKLIEIFGDKA